MRKDSRRLRDCLGKFSTGVTVVTVQNGDLVHGATVSSFTSVSLDPPLVMVCLNRRSRMCARLAGSAFGVNVLAADQRELALHFAGRSKLERMVSWEQSDQSPMISGCVAHLACSPWASYDGGDHILHLGEVRYFEFRNGEPLVFYGGAFRELGGVSDEIAWIGSFDCPTEGIWASKESGLPRSVKSV
ncbi:MAG: flavin reductase family protein [Pseudonocardiaceae bacterium]